MLRVLGSTIGIALRVRCARGWCSFIWLCWNEPELKVFGVAAESTKDGVGCAVCCKGEASGEPEDREDRSEELEE